MTWFLGLLKKFGAILVDIANSIWKSITNRFKNEDGKIAEESSIRKMGKIFLVLLVLGVAYRVFTRNDNPSVFDRYNKENKPPFQVGKQIGNDSGSLELKSSFEKEMRLTDGTLKTTEESTSSGVFSLTPSDANKFSCSEVLKKIQRGEALNKSEREFFKSCLDKNLTVTPAIADKIYPKIASDERPLDPNQAKNAVDTVEGRDDRNKELLNIANKGINAPTGSQEQEMSSKILDWLPSFSPGTKEKTIALAKSGNHEEASKVIEAEQKTTPTKALNDQGDKTTKDQNSTDLSLKTNDQAIDKESAETRLANNAEATRISQEKTRNQNDLSRVQDEIKKYNLPSEKSKEITDIYSSVDPKLNDEAKEEAYRQAQVTCEKSLEGNPKAKEICSKFQKQARLNVELGLISERELLFVKKTGKDPYTYLRYVANFKNGPTAINGARFISQNNENDSINDNGTDADKEVKRRLEEERLRKLSVDPDVYRTKKLLEMRKDQRENINNINGEISTEQTQKPDFTVASAIFYVNTDTKGIVFPVNVKVPCVLADTIYVSDQNLGDKPVHLRITADVFNPRDNSIIAHKGSILSGRPSNLDMETKTLTAIFSKISDGPISDDIQLTVSIRGEAWDTKGKQITGAVLVDYATSILDKITADSKSSVSASDQALLDVVNQSSVTAATSAVQKISQQLATDLQNAKKLFFAPEGARLIIYP